MTEIRTRIAETNDLPQIVEIYNQAIATKKATGDIRQYSTEERAGWFNEHGPQKYPITVACNEDRVLGFISLSPYRKGRGALEKTAEVSYYVHNDFQRQGIGSLLLGATIRDAVSLGYRTIIAILFSINEGSRKLLEKHGFRKWGELPDVVRIDGNVYSHLYYGVNL
ncbi:MAG: N-acetyltransferase [Spirochaetales bacterium]|nr:N-acetyltransferase [Spirochaetales bacterium]